VSTPTIRFTTASRRRAKERAGIYLEELTHLSIAQAVLSHSDSVSERHVDQAAAQMDALVARPRIVWTLLTIVASGLLGVALDWMTDVFRNSETAKVGDLVGPMIMIFVAFALLMFSVPKSRG
jgi:hypothetical protein